MSVVFKNKIKWPRNQLLLPASLFGVNVPAGLARIHVREPNYVDVNGMQAVLRSSTVRSSNTSLGSLGGLVTSSLNVRFANPARQWCRLPAIGGGRATDAPSQFRFSGGDVFLELTLGIYILNTNQPGSDPISVQIFSEVYSHELLHVLDETRTLANWLQSSVTTLPDVSSYLIRARPFTYGRPGQPISIVETAFHTYIQSRIQSEIENSWATEHNRHQALRDSPAQYSIVQERIDALRIRQINSP
jgi:hypothetical protein